MKKPSHDSLDALPQLSNLVDPVRRRLYDYVAAQPESVTREDAAAATGIARTDLLAGAVEAEGTGSVRTTAARRARETGRVAAAKAGGDLDAALGALGYEPTPTACGDIEMRNCPFHQLSQTHPDLVCSLNLDLINGLLEGSGEPIARAELTPHEGRCCVVIHPRGTP